MRNRKVLIAILLAFIGIGIFLSYQERNKSGPWKSSNNTIAWLNSETEAFDSAKNRQKPILVDGWADWCAACKTMDATTFVDPEMLKVVRERWIPLKLDLSETNDPNSQLIAKYGLSGLPATVLLPPDGDFSKRQVIGGLLDAPSLLEHMRRFEAGIKL